VKSASIELKPKSGPRPGPESMKMLVTARHESRSSRPTRYEKGRAKGDWLTDPDGLVASPHLPDPWPRFDPSERSRAFRARAQKPLFTARLQLRKTPSRWIRGSEPCRKETRLLPFLTRYENLSRHIIDRGRRNELRGAKGVTSGRRPARAHFFLGAAFFAGAAFLAGALALLFLVSAFLTAIAVSWLQDILV